MTRHYDATALRSADAAYFTERPGNGGEWRFWLLLSCRKGNTNGVWVYPSRRTTNGRKRLLSSIYGLERYTDSFAHERDRFFSACQRGQHPGWNISYSIQSPKEGWKLFCPAGTPANSLGIYTSGIVESSHTFRASTPAL